MQFQQPVNRMCSHCLLRTLLVDKLWYFYVCRAGETTKRGCEDHRSRNYLREPPGPWTTFVDTRTHHRLGGGGALNYTEYSRPWPSTIKKLGNRDSGDRLKAVFQSCVFHTHVYEHGKFNHPKFYILNKYICLTNTHQITRNTKYSTFIRLGIS
jgi:hypothetical protein